MPSKANPLPISETLRDLALIRVSDINLSALLPSTSESASAASVNPTLNDTTVSVERSYEFVREARTAIKIMDRGDVEKLGSKVEDERTKLEDVLKGIEFD